ncbi:MAG: gluconate:H+ symporter [Sphingomicrobium sp.]
MIFAVILSVALLVLLVGIGKIQPFLAFIISALAAGLMLGMPVDKIPASIETGIGSLLGSLSIIICLGAMFGKLIADSGAAQRIAHSLVSMFGQRRITYALACTGFVTGIPLFYNVGFVLMVPLLFSIVYRTKLPAVYLGIPLLAGLSIAHGFLPPHPSPTALVGQLGASMGLTLLYGFIVAVPTLLIAGPIFATTLRNMHCTPLELFTAEELPEDQLPGAGLSFFCALLPVALIAVATLVQHLVPLSGEGAKTLAFVGNPSIVMLLALTVATLALGPLRGISLGKIMARYGDAVRDIAGILLIIAGAGALKQIYVDSGVSAELGASLAALPIQPLLLGWLVAAVIRICLGSATVAGLTAASIVAPLVSTTGVDPNLMVLAVGAGSLMCSHVNDSGFWMFKEYFNLNLRDTFRSWSLMETIVGLAGLAFVMLLSLFV